MKAAPIVDSLDANLATPARKVSSRRRLILRQTRLLQLSRSTRGVPRVRIALIDGPVSVSHPVLAAATIVQYPQVTDTELADQDHATFIASLLVGCGGGVLAACGNSPENM
jgi:hypothetical protein